MDFTSIVEEKIKQSIQNGELDNLPGKGKPLPKDDLEHIPDELKMGYRILKNANILPEELQLKKEVVSLEEMIAYCEDPEQKEKYRRQLTEKQLRFQMMMEKRRMKQSSAFRTYGNKINNRMGL
ncbi:DnaJ family domain-containing protein [Thalassobacillus hwangdonensis]|uniref:DUF1992 domain-containing protein n=1 Tax=Thalassobacillus hwangdonensis TaxID=546108 RepID=A0ABW3L641_9BACI